MNGGTSDNLPVPAAERASMFGGVPRPYDVLRLAMAIVLLTAAGLKAHQLLTEPTLGTSLLESRWFLIGIVEFEFLLGLLLSSTFLPRHFGSGGEDLWTWIASMALFSAFGCVSLWKALGGEATCGCFGSLEVSPRFSTAMDWAFVAGLIQFRPQSPCPKRFPPTFSPLRVGSVAVIWALLGGPVGYAMATFQATTLSDAGSVVGQGNLVVLEPRRWVGKRLPVLNYINIGDQLAAGQWTVVFYHSGCPDCEAVLRDYRRRARTETFASRIALVEVPPYGDSSESSGLPVPTFISGRLSNAIEWFVKTPLQLKLSDGTVTWQSEQDHDGVAVDDRLGRNRG